jgi:hypothetical protein
MKSIKTEELVQELQRRTGVTSVEVQPFERKSVGSVEIDGPATILIIR